MKPETTPTPWNYHIADHADDYHVAIERQDGSRIADFYNEADAMFALRACNNAQRLADDMREIRDMAHSRSRVNMQNGISLEAFAACSLAQWEKAQ